MILLNWQMPRKLLMHVLTDGLERLALPLATVYFVLELSSQFFCVRNLVFKYVPKWVRPRLCPRCLKCNSPAARSQSCESAKFQRLFQKVSLYWMIVEGAKSLCAFGLISLYHNKYSTTPIAITESDFVNLAWLASWSIVFASHLQSVWMPLSSQRNCGIARASTGSLIFFGALAFANAYYRLSLATKSSSGPGNNEINVVPEVVLAFLFTLFSMLTPPFPPTLPSCLDKSSPDYVVEHASPLSRFFTLWFYGFATGIMKNKDLTPSDFPTEAVDENSENYAKQAYVVYPLMLSNKAWFLWSMLRPFKWKLTKRLVIGIFQSVLTLASSMTIHWLLKRIEEERDLRVIIPESLWLILGIFLRSIISIALDKLEASEAKSLKKQIAIGLSEVLKEIAINQKEFSVSPPLHYQLDDRSKSYSATGGFWGALEWIKKTFFSFRDIKNEDEIAEKLESSKELLKTYTTRVHIKEIGYSATQMCEIIDKLFSISQQLMLFLSSVFLLYSYVGYICLIFPITTLLTISFRWRAGFCVYYTRDQSRILSCHKWLSTVIIDNIRTIKLFGWCTKSNQVLEYLDDAKNQIWEDKIKRGRSSPFFGVMHTFHSFSIVVIHCIGMGNPLTASLFFTVENITSTINQLIHMLSPFKCMELENLYHELVKMREILLCRRMLSSPQNYYHCSKDCSQSADPKHDSLEIRDDAYFVWNIPTVSPDDWIVDDRNYTVMVPEPYTKDTNLKKFNTDSIKHFANNVVLKAINTKIPLGKVTIITGPTGSGKTSLAKALMGEMCCISGQVHFPCYTNNGWPAHGGGYRRWEVGYVSQKPWLQNATFRDNILFGTEFDANRYKRVIYACALDKDLESFPDCDLTLVGEGGVVLSGGQKHRLAMARALYSQAPILIFDDCLSGVDPETAEHLLTHCISPSCELTSGRTVVVVSNQVSMCVAVADNVIVMSEGRIRAQGIWSELISKGVLAGGGQPDPEQQCQAKDYVIPESALQFRIASRDQKQKDVNHSINDSLKSEKSIKVFNILTLKALNRCAKVGLMDWSGYVFTTILLSCVHILEPMIFMFISIDTVSKTTLSIILYFAFDALFRVTKPYCWRYSSKCRSRITRSYMVHLQREIGPTIVNAEPVYFDVTPKEEISTAFSKRSESLAESLVDSVEGIIEIFTWGTLTSICLLKNYPALAIPLFLTGGCFYLVHKLTSQFSSHTDDMEVKHNVNTASYANELDNGIFTIRAFGLECQLLKNYENRSNSFCRLHDCVALSAEWKSSVYSLVNPIMNFSLTTLFLLYALSNGSGLSIVQLLRIDRAQHSLSLRSNGLVLNHAIDTGLMGIMLTKIIVLKQVVESILKLSIKVDLMAKNIRKYFNCLSLPQEGVPHMPNSKVSPEWPEKGEIVFQDFSTSYQRSVQWLLNLSGDTNGSKIDVDEKQNDSRLALDHISFKIKGGERIGIVGRTGAGKSTLSLSLFNFLKAKSGSIEIDGVDISKIGLEDLRSKISIITQDPSVFRGDLGFNVDPFNTHSREHIINILDALELCDRPKDKETGGTDDNKDSIIETGSSSTANPKSSRPFRSLEDIVYESLNKGHQQLISLARALARQSRILVLDEPTASLDYEIDQKIQKVIRGDLTKGATILCIAHRLKTVIDYDRIMVISKGNVAEFDTPANLINDPNTLFHKMCKATKDFDSLAKAANRNNG